MKSFNFVKEPEVTKKSPNSTKSFGQGIPFKKESYFEGKEKQD